MPLGWQIDLIQTEHPVDTTQDALIAVVVNERSCLSMVGIQTLTNRIFIVIWTLN